MKEEYSLGMIKKLFFGNAFCSSSSSSGSSATGSSTQNRSRSSSSSTTANRSRRKSKHTPSDSSSNASSSFSSFYFDRRRRLQDVNGLGGVQNDVEQEIEVRDVTKDGCERASPMQFELLRVLGQGSFGKVRTIERTKMDCAGSLDDRNSFLVDVRRSLVVIHICYKTRLRDRNLKISQPSSDLFYYKFSLKTVTLKNLH